MTGLISNKPTLRWNPVPGVMTYTVGVLGDDSSSWLADTVATQMAYPPDAPSLRPDVNYLLLVTTDNGRSSREEKAPGIGFRILRATEVDDIEDDVRHLDAQALPRMAKIYALALYYAGHDLVSEAIDLLEGLVEGGCSESAVYRSLGDLYRHIGVDGLAEARYLDAIELAEQVPDVEGLALVFASLGEIYLDWGNRSEALRYWDNAIRTYKHIGDRARLEYLEKRVDETQ